MASPTAETIESTMDVEYIIIAAAAGVFLLLCCFFTVVTCLVAVSCRRRRIRKQFDVSNDAGKARVGKSANKLKQK